MALRPSSIPQRVVLPEPPASSLPHVPDPESDLARAASPSVTCLLASVVTDPDLESTAAFALVTELVDFAARSRLDYVATLVTQSDFVCLPFVGGEPALSSDVLEDSHFELECLAAALPNFASLLLCPEGDPDALDIPTPRSYAEAIAGEYSSQWQTAMVAKMASWKSTDTYVDEVPPPGTNIGVDFFQNLSPTPKMTTLRVLLHVAAQRDYKLHSLNISTAFLQGSLHEEIWLRCPPGFTGSFPAVKAELQERHTCTDLGELRSYLGLHITQDRARCTITLTQSHMVHQVLQRFGFQFSSPQPTPLSTGHSLSAPPSDESVEPSGPYPELVGCLMYLMTCTRPNLAYPLSLLARYMAPGRHRKVHWDAVKRVLRYLCSTSGMGLVLGGQGSVVLTGHSDSSWADNQATQRSSQGYTLSVGSGSVSWKSTRSSSVLGSSSEAKIYAVAMAAQELRWLTYLLIDLGERPRSLLVLPHLATGPQLRTCGLSPSAARKRTQHAAAHAACRHAQPAVASSPQPMQSVAARSLRPRALPLATCSLQPRAASRLEQPSGRACYLLPTAACLLPAAAACLLPACCLPAACLLPPACSLPAACLLPPTCLLPTAACLLPACCRLPASCLQPAYLPACCLLPPACSLPAACLQPACYLLPACLLAACCRLPACCLQPACLPACCLQPPACLLHACYLLPACLLAACCCLPPACNLPAACLLLPACLLPAACLPACFLPAAACLLPTCCLPAACLLLAACCRLPACCLLPPACRLPACLLAACCRLPAACLLPACCLPAACLLIAACLLLAAPASCLCLLPPTWCLLPLLAASCLLP
ncbi:unnamed protein product [Closterium sp. NIES-54]